MKKQYIQPATESVKVNLYGSILEGIDIVNNSRDVTNEGLAKETDFDDFNSEEDIWGGRQMKDAWER